VEIADEQDNRKHQSARDPELKAANAYETGTFCDVSPAKAPTGMWHRCFWIFESRRRVPVFDESRPAIFSYLCRLPHTLAVAGLLEPAFGLEPVFLGRSLG
jgi:hypothetical protein